MLEHFSETNEENWYCHSALNYFINNLITARSRPPHDQDRRVGAAHTVYITSNLINEVRPAIGTNYANIHHLKSVQVSVEYLHK